MLRVLPGGDSNYLKVAVACAPIHSQSQPVCLLTAFACLVALLSNACPPHPTLPQTTHKQTQAYYEAVNSGPVSVVPLAQYVSDTQCPYPKPSGGDMALPSWLYNPQTAKCYYKSSFAKGISNNANDAIRRCAVCVDRQPSADCRARKR